MNFVVFDPPLLVVTVVTGCSGLVLIVVWQTSGGPVELSHAGPHASDLACTGKARSDTVKAVEDESPVSVTVLELVVLSTKGAT